jgi:hypothetical protein
MLTIAYQSKPHMRLLNREAPLIQEAGEPEKPLVAKLAAVRIQTEDGHQMFQARTAAPTNLFLTALWAAQLF